MEYCNYLTSATSPTVCYRGFIAWVVPLICSHWVLQITVLFNVVLCCDFSSDITPCLATCYWMKWRTTNYQSHLFMTLSVCNSYTHTGGMSLVYTLWVRFCTFVSDTHHFDSSLVCVCVCVCACVHVQACIHVCVYVCARACAYLCVREYVCAYLCVRVYVHACIRVCVCVCVWLFLWLCLCFMMLWICIMTHPFGG